MAFPHSFDADGAEVNYHKASFRKDGGSSPVLRAEGRITSARSGRPGPPLEFRRVVAGRRTGWRTARCEIRDDRQTPGISAGAAMNPIEDENESVDIQEQFLDGLTCRCCPCCWRRNRRVWHDHKGRLTIQCMVCHASIMVDVGQYLARLRVKRPNPE
jgi:hypothetical protein